MKGLVIWLSLAFAFGCSKEDPRVCEPGRQVVCACPGDVEGIQVCAASGRGYEPCRCEGGSKGPAGGPTARADAGAAPAGPRKNAAGVTEDDLVACPADFRTLANSLVPDDAYSSGGDEWEGEKCTAGLFPAPGWAVVFRRGLAYYQMVIDARTRAVVARADHVGVSGSTVVEVVRLATIDFDGDGASEILSVVNRDKGGYWQQSLSVLRRNGDTLEVALVALLGDHNGGAELDPSKTYAFEATYTVTREPGGRRGIDITGKMTQGDWPSYSADDTPPPYLSGTARYRWLDGRLSTE